LLTAKRRRHIRARLASFGPEDIERAITLLLAPSSWWRENAFTAPEYFCRSDEQLEKLLAREGFRPPRPRETPEERQRRQADEYPGW
jgi:hypothetical protein